MIKGWSSVRGRATHYISEMADMALCGSPIRIDSGTVFNLTPRHQKRLANLEVCDHCQRERRRP